MSAATVDIDESRQNAQVAGDALIPVTGRILWM